MGQNDKRQLNNAGFSLVELIVTVLLMSMIMGMVVIFISTSRKYYRAVSNEAKLQEEAQAATNYIYELLLEATDCKLAGEFDGADVGVASVGKVQVLSIKSATGYSYIVWEKGTGKLRYSSVDGLAGGSHDDTIRDNVKDALGNKYTLLAEHIKSADGLQFVKAAETATSNLYQVTLNLEYDGTSYTTKIAVGGRNTAEVD